MMQLAFVDVSLMIYGASIMNLLINTVNVVDFAVLKSYGMV